MLLLLLSVSVASEDCTHVPRDHRTVVYDFPHTQQFAQTALRLMRAKKSHVDVTGGTAHVGQGVIERRGRFGITA